MHIIEGVNFLLDVIAISSVCIEYLGTRRRCFELGLLRFIVVVVVLVLVINFVVDVVDGVCKGIQIFLLMLLSHKRIVFLLFESHLNWNSTAM